MNAVTQHAMSQGTVASAENEDSTDLEIIDLDIHANMVILGRNWYVVTNSGKIAEIHTFSPDYEAFKVPIVDAFMQ